MNLYHQAQEAFFSDKEREMESAKVKWEEMIVNKQNECQLLQKTVDELNCEMTALKSQLEVCVHVFVYNLCVCVQ